MRGVILPLAYAAYQLMRLLVALFVTVMIKPQPRWLDMKRLRRGER